MGNLEQRAERFRRAAAAERRRGPGLGYSAVVRGEALSYLRRRRAQGVSLWAASRDLGLAVTTLQAWSETSERGRLQRGGGFRRVLVAATAPSVATARGIVVHGPLGVRVEGMDVAGVVELLRGLG